MDALEALVDAECGLVRQVVRTTTPDVLPDRYVSMLADVSDTRTFGLWASDPIALGTTFADPLGARQAAIGEAVERYCGNWIPADLPVASVGELTGDGVPHLGAADLPSFADSQYARPDFPYCRLDDDLPIAWARGRDPDGATVLAPAALVYLNWRHGSRRRLPATHHLNYAGIACGQGLADAGERALLEVVERDAVTLWWMARGPTTGVHLESVPGLVRDLAGCPFDVHLVQVPCSLGLPVLCALVVDQQQDVVAAGTACRPDPAEAARKAVLEALHVWLFTVGLSAPDGPIFQAMDAGTLDRSVYLPFRPDQDYLDLAGPRCAAIRDLGAHSQLWLDRRLHGLLDRITRPAHVVDLERLAPPPPGSVTEVLQENGFRPLLMDLTTPDLAPGPLRVVRSLVPGLLPNTPAAYPYLGMRRLYEEPVRLGWRTTPGTEDDLEYHPLPHT
ncbi:MAG: YcaO-like family protein [Angustibacter sp.]